MSTAGLRRRIDRLCRQRASVRCWVEPIGLRYGIPFAAHVYEQPNGDRAVLEVPDPPLTDEEWIAWVKRMPWPGDPAPPVVDDDGEDERP
jgi:hypothetical protein